MPQKTTTLPKRSIFTEQCKELEEILTAIKSTGRSDLPTRMVKQFTNSIKGLAKISEWAKLNAGAYDQIIERAAAVETPVKTRAARA